MWLILVIRPSAAFLPIFDIIGGWEQFLRVKGAPLIKLGNPRGTPQPSNIPKNGRNAALELITRTNHTNFGINWTSSLGEKLSQKIEYSELFHQLRIGYKLCNGLDDIKGPL